VAVQTQKTYHEPKRSDKCDPLARSWQPRKQAFGRPGSRPPRRVSVGKFGPLLSLPPRRPDQNDPPGARHSRKVRRGHRVTTDCEGVRMRVASGATAVLRRV